MTLAAGSGELILPLLSLNHSWSLRASPLQRHPLRPHETPSLPTNSLLLSHRLVPLLFCVFSISMDIHPAFWCFESKQTLTAQNEISATARWFITISYSKRNLYAFQPRLAESLHILSIEKINCIIPFSWNPCLIYPIQPFPSSMSWNAEFKRLRFSEKLSIPLNSFTLTIKGPWWSDYCILSMFEVNQAAEINKHGKSLPPLEWNRNWNFKRYIRKRGRGLARHVFYNPFF